MIYRDSLTHGWLCGWVSVSMGVSGQITKNFKNVDLIKMIQFCLKILICRDSLTHGWVCGWLSGSMGGIRSNH